MWNKQGMEYFLSMMGIPMVLHIHVYILIILSSIYFEHYSCDFFGIKTFKSMFLLFSPLLIGSEVFAGHAFITEVGNIKISIGLFFIACFLFHISNKMSNEVLVITVTKHIVFKRAERFLIQAMAFAKARAEAAAKEKTDEEAITTKVEIKKS